jgi:hypothetical protein
MTMKAGEVHTGLCCGHKHMTSTFLIILRTCGSSSGSGSESTGISAPCVGMLSRFGTPSAGGRGWECGVRSTTSFSTSLVTSNKMLLAAPYFAHETWNAFGHFPLVH